MTFDLGSWLSNFPVREQMLYLDHAAVCGTEFFVDPFVAGVQPAGTIAGR